MAEVDQPPEGGDWLFPHRGCEDEFIDYHACEEANKAFPQLAKYVGDGPRQVDRDLIAATIRNGQYNYFNAKDAGPDHYIRAHGSWPFEDTESIGPAQMQIRNQVNHVYTQMDNIKAPDWD